MIRRGTLYCIAVAALALFHHPAWAADEPVRLAPSSKWHVEYADDSCRLARRFGEGERTSLVVIERFQPGDYFRLTVTGKAFGRARSGGDAAVRFGPAESRQNLFFLEIKWAETPGLMFTGRQRIAPGTEQEREAGEEPKGSEGFERPELAPIDSEQERAVTFLSVDAPGLPETVFETGSMGEPFAALRRCMDELLTHWGIDVESHKSLTRKAVPAKPPGTWLRSSDYPELLLRKGAQGVVHFRLDVDSEGNVSGCHIQRSTRPEGFDEAVCDALTRRASFEPALDAEGNPISSYYINSVRFAMP